MSGDTNPCYVAFLSAFDLIKKLRAEGGSTCPVLLIKELLPFVERKLSEQGGKPFTIRTRPRDWGGTRIFGALVRYEDSADIIYSTKLNTCWRRFVIAKELAHLFFDDETTFTQDPEQLVDSLIADVCAPNGPLAEFTSEKLAVLMAMELLLPHVERPQIVAMASDGASARKIGVAYKTPAKWVESYLHPEYEAVAKQCWDLGHA